MGAGGRDGSTWNISSFRREPDGSTWNISWRNQGGMVPRGTFLRSARWFHVEHFVEKSGEDGSTWNISRMKMNHGGTEARR
jgi:hypothetical protein